MKLNDIDIFIKRDEQLNYFLCMYINTKSHSRFSAGSHGIVEYFNLPEQYLYDNFSKFNGFIIKKELYRSSNGNCSKIIVDDIYFHTLQDIEKAKQWLINNLEYFLILKKLEGE